LLVAVRSFVKITRRNTKFFKNYFKIGWSLVVIHKHKKSMGVAPRRDVEFVDFFHTKFVYLFV
jgi:hypothetical protein